TAADIPWATSIDPRVSELASLRDRADLADGYKAEADEYADRLGDKMRENEQLRRQVDLLRGQQGGPVSATNPNPIVQVAAETEIPWHTAADIAREQPAAPTWFVPGFIAAGVVTELVGKLKASGKSTFVARASHAILHGTPFLSRTTARTPI